MKLYFFITETAKPSFFAFTLAVHVLVIDYFNELYIVYVSMLFLLLSSDPIVLFLKSSYNIFEKIIESL